MITQIFQCGLSIVVGCIVYAAMEGEYPKARMLGALVAGFAAPFALTYLYVALRYGWRAARSISLDP